MRIYLISTLLIFAAFNAQAREAEGALSAGADTQNLSSDSSDDSSMYEGFEYDINFGDCLDFQFSFGGDMCPGFPTPYPTLTLEYKYNDVVAMVEVVPDPWRSHLYKESFFDFSSKADVIASGLGMEGSIGSGFGNRKSNAKEFIGNHKLETHVWAVSDWWRLKVKDAASGCVSLTCKNEDYTGCIMSIKQSMSSMSEGSMATIDSINQGEEVDGKGEGYTQQNEDGSKTVSYEDGSMYQQQEDGSYKEVRKPGNYGDGSVGLTAETAMSESIIPGMSNLELTMDSMALASDPEGFAKTKAVMAGAGALAAGSQAAGGASGSGASGGAAGSGDNSQYLSDNANQENVDAQAAEMDGWATNKKTELNGKSDALPEDTKTRQAEISEMEPVDGAMVAGNDVENGKYKSTDAGNATSDNMQNNNSEGNSTARNDMQNNIPGAGDSMGSDGLNQAMAIIDRIVYFSPIEQAIQMIASMSPVMLAPVYMSERHADPSADGGFFWAPLFQSFADMGAGLIMPIFCMTKTVGMAVDGTFEMLMGEGLSSDMLGPISSFINARCVGSWGPLEPRVTMLGTGDNMVAAGLASVRGLNIAQNITGDMYNKSINNTPFNKLTFNLEWPHQSSCYGFTGFKGLSRGWTTPLGGALDGISNAVQSGNMSSVANAASSATVGGINNQGGYIFTYWRNRKCRYLISCEEWRGDTGL